MYKYAEERPNLFTEDGFVMLTKMRDAARELLAKAGAVRSDRLMSATMGGYSWLMLAAIDYLVETGFLKRITDSDTWGQHQVFVSGFVSGIE